MALKLSGMAKILTSYLGGQQARSEMDQAQQQQQFANEIQRQQMKLALGNQNLQQQQQRDVRAENERSYFTGRKDAYSQGVAADEAARAAAAAKQLEDSLDLEQNYRQTYDLSPGETQAYSEYRLNPVNADGTPRPAPEGYNDIQPTINTIFGIENDRAERQFTWNQRMDAADLALNQNQHALAINNYNLAVNEFAAELQQNARQYRLDLTEEENAEYERVSQRTFDILKYAQERGDQFISDNIDLLTQVRTAYSAMLGFGSGATTEQKSAALAQMNNLLNTITYNLGTTNQGGDPVANPGPTSPTISPNGIQNYLLNPDSNTSTQQQEQSTTPFTTYLNQLRLYNSLSRGGQAGNPAPQSQFLPYSPNGGPPQFGGDVQLTVYLSEAFRARTGRNPTDAELTMLMNNYNAGR